jgi:hypothetical protein
MTALLAAFRASEALASPVAVRDGPVTTASSARDVVIVGWEGDEGDEVAVEATETAEGLAPIPDREQYSVRCAVMSRSGAGDPAKAIADARARVCALHAACGAAIAADRTLGGSVMRARMGDWSLSQVPDQYGQKSVIRFSVEVDAYSGR